MAFAGVDLGVAEAQAAQAAQARAERKGWALDDERVEEDGSDRSTDLGSEHGCSDDERDRLATDFSADAQGLSLAEETLLIFDWDDTLFPTSWLDACGVLLSGDVAGLTAPQRAAMARLAEAVENTVQQAMSHGRVVIITNAVEGWVQESAARFMPSLAPLLEQIPIVSARSAHERRGVRSPTQWKTMAFGQLIDTFCVELREGRQGNVVSIGDSVHEHCALLQATSERDNCFAKALKFAERPSLEQMVEEHLLASGSLLEVLAYEGDLDVDVGDVV